MNHKIKLQNPVSCNENTLNKLKHRLEKLPEERIYSRMVNGNFRYYIRFKGNDKKYHEKHISKKNEEFIKACCEASYLRKLIPVLERELKETSIRAIHNTDDVFHEKEKAWEKLPKGINTYVKPLFFSNKDICNNWENEQFETNPYPINGTAQYVTKKGETVRSRIELIIADMLYDLGIPYRYECKLELPAGEVYPDFTIVHPATLELYYIEIFGMMDNPEYEKAAFSKISKYAASELYNHLLMFFDHKDAPISTVNIKRLFKQFV